MVKMHYFKTYFNEGELATAGAADGEHSLIKSFDHVTGHDWASGGAPVGVFITMPHTIGLTGAVGGEEK